MKKKFLMTLGIAFAMCLPTFVNAKTETIDGKTCKVHDNYYLFYLEMSDEWALDNQNYVQNDVFEYNTPVWLATFKNNIPTDAKILDKSIVEVTSSNKALYHSKIFQILDKGNGYVTSGDESYFVSLESMQKGATHTKVNYPFFYDNETYGYSYDNLPETQSGNRNDKTELRNEVLESIVLDAAKKTTIMKDDKNSDSKEVVYQIQRKISLPTLNDGTTNNQYIPKVILDVSFEMGSYYSAAGVSNEVLANNLNIINRKHIIIPAMYKVSWYEEDDCTTVAKKQYTIKYDANGGTNAPAQHTKLEGETAYISKQAPTRNGYTFLGWSIASSAREADSKYNGGASYTENADLTLYAVWTPKSGLGYSIGIISAMLVFTGVGVWYFSKRNKFENI